MVMPDRLLVPQSVHESKTHHFVGGGEQVRVIFKDLSQRRALHGLHGDALGEGDAHESRSPGQGSGGEDPPALVGGPLEDDPLHRSALRLHAMSQPVDSIGGWNEVGHEGLREACRWAT